MRIETQEQNSLNVIFEQDFMECPLYTDKSEFFEFFAAKQVLKEFDLSDEEVSDGIVGGGNDGGCDGIYVFANGVLVSEDGIESLNPGKDPLLELIIIQAKMESSFSETPLSNWKTTITNLLSWDSGDKDFSTRYSESIIESFNTFRNIYTKCIRNNPRISIDYYYCSFAKEIHPNVQQQANELVDVTKTIYRSQNTKVNVHFFDAKKIVETYQSRPNQIVTLNLIDTPIEKNNAYVALVNLREYYRFITDGTDHLQSQFFESNIRDYQGHVQVNQDIQNTLFSEPDKDFWWFNNGITVVASKATIATTKSLLLTEPSIVNGLQTSNEVFNYYQAHPEALDHEERNIMVRVIIPQNEMIRDRIILATNNQTSIPKASLRVNDPIHWHIEQYFKSKSLYYDRRKNYYKNQGKNICDIVSVSFLSQCLMTLILQKPDYARARPSTLLKSDSDYNTLFSGNITIDGYYRVAMLGKKIQHFLKLSPDYTASQKNDLLFYVLYYAVARILNKSSFVANDINNLDLNSYSGEHISSTAAIVYQAYNELGGNGQVAKGTALKQKLEELINSSHAQTDNPSGTAGEDCN